MREIVCKKKEMWLKFPRKVFFSFICNQRVSLRHSHYTWRDFKCGFKKQEENRATQSWTHLLTIIFYVILERALKFQLHSGAWSSCKVSSSNKEKNAHEKCWRFLEKKKHFTLYGKNNLINNLIRDLLLIEFNLWINEILLNKQ